MEAFFKGARARQWPAGAGWWVRSSGSRGFWAGPVARGPSPVLGSVGAPARAPAPGGEGANRRVVPSIKLSSPLSLLVPRPRLARLPFPNTNSPSPQRHHVYRYPYRTFHTRLATAGAWCAGGAEERAAPHALGRSSGEGGLVQLGMMLTADWLGVNRRLPRLLASELDMSEDRVSDSTIDGYVLCLCLGFGVASPPTNVHNAPGHLGQVPVRPGVGIANQALMGWL